MTSGVTLPDINESEVVRRVRSGAHLSGFKSHFHHLPAIVSWASYFNLLLKYSNLILLSFLSTSEDHISQFLTDGQEV